MAIKHRDVQIFIETSNCLSVWSRIISCWVFSMLCSRPSSFSSTSSSLPSMLSCIARMLSWCFSNWLSTFCAFSVSSWYSRFDVVRSNLSLFILSLCSWITPLSESILPESSSCFEVSRFILGFHWIMFGLTVAWLPYGMVHTLCMVYVRLNVRN